MKIPFQNLTSLPPDERQSIEEAALRTIRSGRYVLNREVLSFEKEFASSMGKEHCISVGNGLDALRIALLAGVENISPGDEVIVPAQTFIATWIAVIQAGMVPVAVDVDTRYGLLDLQEIVRAITPRTRTILPVHLFGFSVDLRPLQELARQHHLFLLEDAAQAHGHANLGLGDATAFSFYPTKNLGALGDGGAIVTNRADIAERAAQLRNYGKNNLGEATLLGSNSRLDELQAAILKEKLRFLPRSVEERRSIARFYLETIRHPEITLPGETEASSLTVNQGVWHLFPIRTQRRAELQEHLASHGIETAIHYSQTPYQQSALKNHPALWRIFASSPSAERWANEELSLPLYPGMTQEMLHAVAEACNAF